MSQTLASLLHSIPATDVISIEGDQSTPVSAPVVENSLDVQPGGVFVARAGQSSDGNRYIPQAIAAGAAAIVGERDLTQLPVAYIRVKDAQAILGLLSAAYHNFPSRKLIVIGVTGTDGKTTTCHLLHSVLTQVAGIRPGYISTVSADFGAESAFTGLHVTTPGAPQVQAYLARMVDAGVTHCILEMTSHGLAQGRVRGVDIDVAVLTNVMHEHIDFHCSWQNYRAAKALMFEMLTTSWRKDAVPKLSVINADDASAAYFAVIPADRTVRYGIHSDAEYRATGIRFAPAASSFCLDDQLVTVKLPGEFNISNAMAAIAAARELEIPWSAVKTGIAEAGQIPGRMERIDEGQAFDAIVDFAHTPNALKRALQACRQMLAADKRLIAVFGSAGLRDEAKRRLMAETSAQLADLTILTAEDPRTESLDEILALMAGGCIAQGGREGESFVRVPDRGEAIFSACQRAASGDLVIACGKGHEQSMCFGKTEHPWDDREAMRSALRGAPLLTLPTARRRKHASD